MLLSIKSLPFEFVQRSRQHQDSTVQVQPMRIRRRNLGMSYFFSSRLSTSLAARMRLRPIVSLNLRFNLDKETSVKLPLYLC